MAALLAPPLTLNRHRPAQVDVPVLRDEDLLMATSDLTATPVAFLDARDENSDARSHSFTEEGIFILSVDDVTRTVRVAHNRPSLLFPALSARVATGLRRAWYAVKGELTEAVMWMEFRSTFEGTVSDPQFATALNGPYCVEIARVWDTRIPQLPGS